MTPFKVNNIVNESEQDYHADCKEAGIILDKSFLGKL